MEIVNKLLEQFGNGTKQHEERQIPQEYHYVGSQKKVKGHILFSFNVETGELKQAQLKREVIMGIDKKPIYKTTATQEKDCIYFQALNMKNAKKRLLRMFKELENKKREEK